MRTHQAALCYNRTIMNESNLIWLDLEMTGFDLADHRIIEIATIVTDKDLRTIAEGPDIIIHQNEDVLKKMSAWCVENFCVEGGLADMVRKSNISTHEAEEQTLAFVKKFAPSGISPLCGNSVHQDRRFLLQEMPKLANFFHYRNIDVSTIKELARRWYPDVYESLEKDSVHRALDDIRESIKELQMYRDKIFVK